MAEGGGENLPSDDHDPNVKRKMIIQEYWWSKLMLSAIKSMLQNINTNSDFLGCQIPVVTVTKQL